MKKHSYFYIFITFSLLTLPVEAARTKKTTSKKTPSKTAPLWRVSVEESVKMRNTISTIRLLLKKQKSLLSRCDNPEIVALKEIQATQAQKITTCMIKSLNVLADLLE